MKNWQIPRRTFLKGLGAALALPALDIMGSSARAATGGPPVRFAAIFQPNGVFPKAWDVAGAGADYQISPILEPLAGLRNDLLILSNLDNNGQGHVQMTTAFLTGVPIVNGKTAVSLDQMIARQIGRDTRFPSIQLGTEPPRQGNAAPDQPIALANTVSWTSPTARLSPEINPQVAFDRMFRTLNSPEARREAADRKSVVDLVMDDAKSLKRQASVRDQQKIDEYLEGVRAVEVGIDRVLNPPAPAWTPRTQPALVRPGDGVPRQRDQHLRLMMDLMVLALWTDTTRVATLMAAHGFSRQNFSFLDGVTSDHHGMSHHKFEPRLVAEYTKVSHWYIQQFAYLLEKMKGIDEGNGSLLDNTIMLYGCAMKDGNGHIKKDLPILLAGRGGGMLKPGRRVIYPAGTPISDLHLTLAQKFGVEADHFNHASRGTLTELG